MQLHDGWRNIELDASDACRKALTNRVTIFLFLHSNPSQRICVYTNVSDLFWSVIVSQMPTYDVSKPHKDQRQVPIALQSERLDATEPGWSVLEREALAVSKSGPHALDRVYTRRF